jgi:hypothetical protein
MEGTMMDLEVNVTVTAADIEHASRNDPTACPIALAMRRVFRRPVSVGTTLASVIYPDREDIYSLPLKAQRFIGKFDAKRLIRPITFHATYVYTSTEDE